MADRQVSFTADYNDGATAARTRVLLRVTPAGLAITPEGEATPLATWPYETLVRLDEAFKGAPLRLAEKGGEARLTLRDGGLPEDLAVLAPQLVRRPPRASRAAALWFSAFVGAIAVLALVIFSLPVVARYAVPLVPKAWEEELGRRLVDQVVALFSFDEEKRPEFCVAPAGEAVLGRLTQRLASTVESPFSFDVRVLDLDIANAIALPGGPIIVFKGLLDQADTPDELAGVLAHEMSHVTHRHSMERLMEAVGLSFIFGVMLGDISSGLLLASGEAVVSLSYSRRAESEADDGAVVILAESEISTQGLSDFFKRNSLLPEEAENLVAFLSTHPASATRARRFSELAEELPPALSPEDWRALKAICDRTGP